MKQSYQKMQAELDEIVAQLQRSDIDVESAIALHERGQKLVAQIEAYLQQSENTITRLQAPTAES